MSDYYPENKTNPKCCKNCEHFVPSMYNDNSEADYGECRRFPPKRITETESKFPVVIDDHWCGEYLKHQGI